MRLINDFLHLCQSLIALVRLCCRLPAPQPRTGAWWRSYLATAD